MASKATLLNASLFADVVTSNLRTQIDNHYFVTRTRPPRLHWIAAGTGKFLKLLERKQREQCEALGCVMTTELLTDVATDYEIIECIDRANRDKNIDGILVQQPLPPHLDVGYILLNISPEKDVTGMQSLRTGTRQVCAIYSQSIVRLLDHHDIRIYGTHVVLLFDELNDHARVIALDFLHEFATVSICHRATATQTCEDLVRVADILVVYDACKETFSERWIPRNCVVIDTTIRPATNSDIRPATNSDMHTAKKGRLVGTLDFDFLLYRVEYLLAPQGSPGGLLPIWIAMIVENLLHSMDQVPPNLPSISENIEFCEELL